MSAENPREVFDKNEAGIAQKNKELTDAVAAGDYGKVAELAQEAKNMEAAKAEMKEDAHGEALEMNSEIDAAKAAEEKAGREAALAEQARQDTERSEQEAAALLEKMKGGSPENLSNNGEKISEELGNSLREVFHEFYSPEQNANTRELIEVRWKAISDEIMSKLSDLDDFKEYSYYLRGKNEAFDEKWDALSTEEVNSATTEDEMKNAMEHIRNGGYETPMKLKDMLEKKYQALTGKPYPVDYSGMRYGSRR